MSASFWWNKNELTEMIKVADGKKISKQVAIYVGMAEGTMCQNSQYVNPPRACLTWLSQIEAAYNAFVTIGLQTNVSLFSFTAPLNQHTGGAYITMIPVLLRSLYTAKNFPNGYGSNQIPFADTLGPLSCGKQQQTQQTSSSSSGCTPCSDVVPIAVGTGLSFIILVLVILLVKEKRKKIKPEILLFPLLSQPAPY